jgi:cytochrome c5
VNQHDKSFLTVTAAILGGLVVITVVVFVIARIVTKTVQDDTASRVAQETAIAERIRPVGTVVIAGDEPEPTAGSEAIPTGGSETASAGEAIDGQALYAQSCAACHDTGAANAPKIGDQAAWTDRIGQGNETLVKHALSGFNAMPPKGGAMQLSDAEVGAIVEYMVGSSK